MGLLKETMQAIIRIDRNLAAIRRVLTRDDDKLFRATYLQKPIEHVRTNPQTNSESELPLFRMPFFDQLPHFKEFPYPDHLTLGGRVKAIRIFSGLTQTEFGRIIDVSYGHISNVERDQDVLSDRGINKIADRFNIDETWLATGHLPPTAEDPAKPIATSKVTPLSGYDGAEELQKHLNLQRQTRLEVESRLDDQKDPVLQRLREVDYRKETEQADPTQDERQDG